MKTKWIIFLLILGFNNQLFSQFTLGTPKKVCIDNMSITELYELLSYNNGFIVNTSKGGNKGGVVLYDPVSGMSKPINDYKRFHYVNGPNFIGNDFYFGIDKSTYNEKTKKAEEKSILYFSDNSGELKDSLNLNFSIIYLPSVTDRAISKIPMIIQLNSKMSLVVVDIKSGTIIKTIFTESRTSIGTDLVPSAISVDPNMKYFAYGTANGDGGFAIYDYQTFEPVYTQKEKCQIHCIKFSSDSRYCFVMNIDTKTLTVVDIFSKSIAKKTTFEYEFSHFGLHPNDEYMVFSGGATGVQLYNWKTDEKQIVNLDAITFQSDFTADGKGIGVTSRGLECMINKDKLPYFSYIPLISNSTENYSNNNSNNNNNSNSSNMKYKLGERVLAYFPLTGERYSAVIKKVNNEDYDVLYDDGQTRGTVTDLQINPCPPLKVDEVVYAINKQGYLKWATVTKIDGDNVEVWYDNGGKEMTTRNKIIQVEH